MSKIKFSLISKGDWSSGFRLAGVETLQAKSPQEARILIQPFLEGNEPSLIAIEEELFPVNDRKLQKRLEEKPFPVILPIPKIDVSKEDQEKYVSELVRTCIGYYVKLK